MNAKESRKLLKIAMKVLTDQDCGENRKTSLLNTNYVLSLTFFNFFIIY